MARNQGKVWAIQPHTVAKHAILRRYLAAWVPIMGRRSDHVVYFDGFAGPGEYENGEPGSPIIALQLAVKHRNPGPGRISFVFVERDTEASSHLRSAIEAVECPENISAEVVNGTFEEEMERYLDQRRKLGVPPTFAFIDPFGFSGLPMRTIKRLMNYERCEVFINFMYEPINRFINHPEEGVRRNFDALFGRTDWLEDVDLRSPRTRKSSIHDLYLQELKKQAGISYLRSFEMLNENNQTEYFLVFGTNSLEGLKKMKAAMWNVDTLDGGRFSDTTSQSSQVPLFTEPNYHTLKKLIVDRFDGKGPFAIESLEHFVITETPFRETHYKKQILTPWEKEGRLQVERPGRSGFPGGTILTLST